MLQEKSIRFGPSGNSEWFYEQGKTSSVQAPAWLAALGLGAYEYSFGRGIRIAQQTAGEIGEEAKLHDVAMSIHLPYYINLSTEEDAKKEKNVQYFSDGLRMAIPLGATRAVFHPGSVAGGSRHQALERACALLKRILQELPSEFAHITLCPETMGKINQLGTLEEVLALCKLYACLLPCIDFGHLHARGHGAIKHPSDYAHILDTIENEIGIERAKRLHVHFSKIEFTKGGEKMHRTFADTEFGPDFAPLAVEFARRDYAPIVICESKGTMAEDALIMKGLYESALQAHV